MTAEVTAAFVPLDAAVVLFAAGFGIEWKWSEFARLGRDGSPEFS